MPDLTIHQLVARQAPASASTVAHGARRLTYADLDRLAGAFAARLAGAGYLGVRRADRRKES